MKHLVISKLALGAVIAMALVAVPNVSARAEHGSSAGKQARATQMRETAENARTEAEATIEEKKAAIQVRLEEKRKMACERREQRINAIVDNSAEKAKRHLAVFQKIEERVKTFYEEKRSSSSEYASIAAEVETKEAAAISAIEATSVLTLDCDAEGDQRQIGTHIKDTVKSHQAALKEYRTAIKNLIVAVAQADKDTTEETDTTTGDVNEENSTPTTNGSRQEGRE